MMSAPRSRRREAKVWRSVCHVTPSIFACSQAFSRPAARSTNGSPVFLVVEDELVLLSQSPEIQNPAHFRVDRNDAGLLGFHREHVNQTSVQVYVLPAEGENLPDAASRIQSVKNDILNRGCGIPQQTTDRVANLGNSAIQSANAQDWPRALAQMKEAIAVCGECAEAAHLHRNLGLMYCRTGNLEDGEKELRAALELDPNDVATKKTIDTLENLRGASAKGTGVNKN
jgi:tetratricopeptide (TPR) repeat protein